MVVLCTAPSLWAEVVVTAFESLFSLSDAERKLDDDGALASGRDLLHRRETPGALEHVVALLHEHRAAHHEVSIRSAELAALLAEAHARLADTLNLGRQENKERHRQHREAGIVCTEEAIRLDPQNGPAHYWRGRLLLCAAEAEQSYSRLKQAVEALEAAEHLDPGCDEAGPLRYLGRIYQKTPSWPMLGSTQKAIAHYERAAAIAPNNLQIRLWLGETYATHMQPEKGRAEWERVIAAPFRPGHEKEDGALKAQALVNLAALKQK